MQIRRYEKGVDTDSIVRCKKCDEKYPVITIEAPSVLPDDEGHYCEDCAALLIAEHPRLVAGALLSVLLRPQEGVHVNDDMLRRPQ